MARPLRIEYPGAVHHPTARDKNSTFKTPALRGSRMDFSALSLCTSAFEGYRLAATLLGKERAPRSLCFFMPAFEDDRLGFTLFGT